MHKYLNAIGFHDIASEREWYQILLESEKKFSGYDRIALDEYTDLCELRREYGLSLIHIWISVKFKP